MLHKCSNSASTSCRASSMDFAVAECYSSISNELLWLTRAKVLSSAASYIYFGCRLHMPTEFKVKKVHCKRHNVDFEKLIRIKVSCSQYQKCREAAIKRHETNIANSRLEAKKSGKRWVAPKAVLQTVCPYEEPPKYIPWLKYCKTQLLQ